MIDKVEKINNTIVQHGKQNDRVYIMKTDDREENIEKLIENVDILADKNKYTKIFAKVPQSLGDIFIENEYTVEAEIPRFYNKQEKCLFMAKYLEEDRSVDRLKKTTDEVLKVANSKEKCRDIALDNKYIIKKCKQSDVEDICALYGQVFETYPFPIFDPRYIKEMMDDNVIYFGIWDKDELIAVSAIELYRDDRNAEMTDFATDSDYRGQNLSLHLLSAMEEELKQLKITMAYTIARAVSFAMNCTFSKLGYDYAGTLINNTNIGGQIESMNVWFKNIET